MLSVSGFLTAGLAALALSSVPVAQAQSNWVRRCQLGIVTCEDCRRNIVLAQGVYTPGAGNLFIDGVCEDLVSCTCARDASKDGKCTTDNIFTEDMCSDLAKLRAFCGARGVTVGAANFCLS